MGRLISSGIRNFGVILVLVSCFSCGGQKDEGSVEVTALALTAADIASVAITITGTGISNPMVVALSKASDHWGGIIGAIPIGANRTFTLSARNAPGTEIYLGQATGVTITAGQTVSVIIIGQQVNAPPPLLNAAPVIDALVVSSVYVAPGELVSLTVLAHDPNLGDVLSYHWTAQGGSFASATTATTNWTAPQSSGSHRITIEVRDQKNAKATMDVSIEVDSSHGRGKARIDAGFNTWPVVEDLTADPGRIDVGETTALVGMASDADGDSLSYSWSSDCAGTFSSAASASTSFTLSALPTAAACTFTVAITDGRGGSNTGTLAIAAGPPPIVNLAPQVLSTYQSREIAAYGDTVILRVQAIDPNGTPLRFTWTTTSGTLSTPSTQPDGSEVVWTAPNSPTGAWHPMVTVKDAQGATTTEVFTISPTVCLANNGGCDPLTSCTNTPGGPVCGHCPAGYTGTGETGCVDVNECHINNGGCDPLMTCVNAPGSRTCVSCPGGCATSIAANQHTCAVMSSGSVLCWGLNEHGQLGNGNSTNSSVPTSVTGVTNAVSVAVGAYHTCAVMGDGLVQCWGYNGYGQAGNVPATRILVPVKVLDVTNAIAVAAGDMHTCAVLSSGLVQCWGYNGDGQLGDGTTIDSYLPVTVSGVTNAIGVTAGIRHTCAVLSDGAVRCWGYNREGELGDGTTTNSHVPVTVLNVANAELVAAGNSHTCAMLNSGRVRCWGGNIFGQLGDGTTATTDGCGCSRTSDEVLAIGNAVSIAAGAFHTCAILGDGSVRCWGINEYGGLGNGSTTTPGCQCSSTGVQVSGITDAIALAGGAQYACAVLATGSVRCWGYNRYGQLGNATTNSSSVPVVVSGF